MLLAMNDHMEDSISGDVINDDLCRYWKEPLVDYDLMQNYKQQQPIKISEKRKLEMKNLYKETNQLSIIKFINWGHTMHLKCLPKHRNCVYADEND